MLKTPEQTDPNCQKCLTFLYFFSRIHDLFLLGTADHARAGKLLSPRFPDSKPNYIFCFLLALLLPGHSSLRVNNNRIFPITQFLVKWKTNVNSSCLPLAAEEKTTINTQHQSDWRQISAQSTLRREFIRSQSLILQLLL